MGTSVFFFSSCSSLFYQPSHITHFPPQMIHANPEDVWIDTPNSGKVHGWFFRSRAPTAAKTLVVFFHGNAANISSHYLNLYWILKEPVDFFVFDYRGYGLSTFAQGKVRPITRESTIEDGVAVLRWAQQQRSGKKLVVLGQSLGGAIAPVAISKVNHQVPVDLLFLDSTFHSYQEAGRSVIQARWWTWPFQPLAYVLLEDAHSPQKVYPLLKDIPTIVLHGDEDRVIRYSVGEKVFERLQSPKELWRIPGGGHADSFWRHEGLYRRKFVEKISELHQKEENLANLHHASRTPDLSYSYQLPVPSELEVQILQGAGGSYSHKGLQKFAVDFKLESGTLVHAARDGVVLETEAQFSEGKPENEFLKKANFVNVQHEDGTVAEYVHLLKDAIFVKPGQKVRAGQILARSGNSGFSSKPHLHFMVFTRQADGSKKSIPVLFTTQKGPAQRLVEHRFYRRPESLGAQAR